MIFSLRLFVFFTVTFTATLASAQAKVEAVWGETIVRDAAVAAAFDVINDKNALTRARACALVSKRPDLSKYTKTIRKLTRAKFSDTARCALQLLAERESKAPQDFETFRRATTSKDKTVRQLAIVSLAKRGVPLDELRGLVTSAAAFESSTNIELLVHTATSVDSLMAELDRSPFSAYEVAEAIARFRKTHIAQTPDARFDAHRKRLTELLRQKPHELGRSTLVQAIVSLAPSPREAVALFANTTGYFEHLVLLNAMKSWSDDEAWAVPEVLALLRADDPLVFEVISALNAIATPPYHALIAVTLRPFLSHPTFGPAVGKYLVTLRDAEALTIWAVRNRLPSAELMLVKMKQRAKCDAPSPLSETLVDLEPYDDLVYAAAVTLLARCGVDATLEKNAAAFLAKKPDRAATILVLRAMTESNHPGIVSVREKTPIGVDVAPEQIVTWLLDGTLHVINASRYLKTRPVESHVVPVLDDDDAKRRKIALDILAHVPTWSDAATGGVIARLADSDPLVQFAALRAFSGHLGPTLRARDAIGTFTQSPNAQMRHVAYRLLLDALPETERSIYLAQLASTIEQFLKDCGTGCEPIISMCRHDPAVTSRALKRALSKPELRSHAIVSATQCDGLTQRSAKPFIQKIGSDRFDPTLAAFVLRLGDQKQIRRLLRAPPIL